MAQFELWLSTTEWLMEARDAVNETAPSADATDSLMQQMSANRRAVAKLQNALRALPDEDPAAGDILTPVEGAGSPLIVTLKTRDELAKTMADVAQLQADVDEGWKDLASGHAPPDLRPG